jgi:hypothetical protein
MRATGAGGGSAPKRRFARDVILLVIGAVITLLVTDYGGALLREIKGTPPSLSGQLAGIERVAAKRHLEAHIVMTSLEGNGTPSVVVVSSFIAYAAGANPERPLSDELRIYDIAGSGDSRRLVPRFTFVGQANPRVSPFTDAWRFEVIAIHDFAHDGRQEIFGAFTENRADTADRRPVLISWDPGSERYVMSPLLVSAVHLASAHTERAQLEDRRLYRHSATIADPSTGVAIRDFGTPGALLLARDREPLLITAAATGEEGRPGLELEGFGVEMRALPVKIYECGHGVVSVPLFTSLGPEGLAQLWNRIPKGLGNYCG